ncbi:MAG: hypothetical protein H0W88_05170 [Parachlamydiaceae bacterium]|nr:hypothetical protein [Parachlamydiaceae bacterium]
MESTGIFNPPIMEITVADVYREEDRNKLCDKIHGKLKEKIVQRLFHSSAYMIGLAALGAIISKIFVSLSARRQNNSLELFAVTLLPIAIYTCRMIYNVAKGIIMAWKLQGQPSYAKAFTDKLTQYFNEQGSHHFAVTMNFDDYTTTKELKIFDNGITEFRSNTLLLIHRAKLIDGVVKAIKDHGLASLKDYCEKEAISAKDPNWKAIIA